ncbi:MMPL family transporter [Erythrobacter gaetbuli]|uniref:MMPL family transporter n=1 Tax=Qipengyuania gaetbuli TaxID=266952 RepID=A0A844XUX8_9SPHN|nr:MMPL family transporter [Qipengyuania gaetbuli]MXO49701.1 MMPL family transporter [Qipengyuania gaetbuli]
MESAVRSSDISSDRVARLGLICWRKPWLVIAGWTIVCLAAALAIPQMSDRLLSGSGKIEGSVSQRVDSQLVSEFEVSEGQSLVLVYHSQDLVGRAAAADEIAERVDETLAQLETIDRVIPATDIVEDSGDGSTQALIINFRLDNSLATEQQVPLVRAKIDRLFSDVASSMSHLEWAITGRAALTYDINIFSARDSADAELRAIPLTSTVLLLTFGTILSAILPIVLAIAARTAAFASILVIAGEWEVSNLAQSITTMISLALGIDYALFIYHRYRRELGNDAADRDHKSAKIAREAAMLKAMANSGKVVLYSGTVVAIGMGGLLLTPLMQTRSIGLGGLCAVIFSVASALTLLPALLSLIAPNVLDWPRMLRIRMPPQAGTRWTSWGQIVVKRPLTAIFSSLCIMALLAAPAMQTVFGFPEDDFLPEELESARGLTMLEDLGAKGLVSPVFIIVSDASGRPVISLERTEALSQFIAKIGTDPRVSEVLSPSLTPGTRYTPFGMPSADQMTNDAKDKILLRVVPSTKTDLAELRQLADEIPYWLDDRSLFVEVGGQAQYFNDFDARMKDGYAAIVGIVLGATGMLLLVLFRAPVAALKAMLLNLLSVGAGYGMVVFVFQLGYGATLFGLEEPTELVPTSVPIVIFAVLFGLSMDYEIFLISRMRESFLRHGDNALSIVEGLAATGSVITGAALIMAVVFGAFAFSGIVILQMTGLGLATAVIVDAVIIRSLLGPALMTLAGGWNWWPLKVDGSKIQSQV